MHIAVYRTGSVCNGRTLIVEGGQSAPTAARLTEAHPDWIICALATCAVDIVINR